MSEPYLTITPLGGHGEIGMNCQKWQTDQGVVLVDCGLMFPDDALLGVDVVIPRLESVFTEGEKVLGIVLKRILIVHATIFLLVEAHCAAVCVKHDVGYVRLSV